MNNDELKRHNLLLYEGNIVEVLTISKTSLRVFNISNDNYIGQWVDTNKFDPLPLSARIVEDMGFDNNRTYFKKVVKGRSVFISPNTREEWVLDLCLRDCKFVFKYHHDLYNFIELLKKTWE